MALAIQCPDTATITQVKSQLDSNSWQDDIQRRLWHLQAMLIAVQFLKKSSFNLQELRHHPLGLRCLWDQQPKESNKEQLVTTWKFRAEGESRRVIDFIWCVPAGLQQSSCFVPATLRRGGCHAKLRLDIGGACASVPEMPSPALHARLTSGCM